MEGYLGYQPGISCGYSFCICFFHLKRKTWCFALNIKPAFTFQNFHSVLPTFPSGEKDITNNVLPFSKTVLFAFLQAFISTGFNVLLSFDPTPGFNPANRQCDFEKEPGKVIKFSRLSKFSSCWTLI